MLSDARRRTYTTCYLASSTHYFAQILYGLSAIRLIETIPLLGFRSSNESSCFPVSLQMLSSPEQLKTMESFKSLKGPLASENLCNRCVAIKKWSGLVVRWVIVLSDKFFIQRLKSIQNLWSWYLNFIQRFNKYFVCEKSYWMQGPSLRAILL